MRRLLPLLAAVALVGAQEPKKFPDALDGKILTAIKSATVLVEVRGSGYESSGSGFIVSPQGHIVTNKHVVESRLRGSPDEITVVLYSGTEAQKRLKAEKVLVDPVVDLALLKIESEGLAPLGLGDPLHLAETVTMWAFGYPLGNLFREGEKGPEISVNKGGVSSLRKSASGALELIQIDTQVNPGNSGGPLVGGDGRVYGVITSGIRDSSLRFAIPSDAVARFLAARIIRCDATPNSLSVEGGSVAIEAEVQEVLSPPDRVVAVVEVSGASKEVDLSRSGKVWKGTWACPALADADRRRVEVQVTFRDQTSKTFSYRGGPIALKSDFGALTIPAEEIGEITFGESGKPDRVVTSRGSYEGRLEQRSLDVGESLAAEKIRSASFEVKIGRTYDIRIRVKAGGREALGPPTTVAVGAPAPRAKPGAASFEARMSSDFVEKKLPGTLESVKMGGGGRLLILHFKTLNTLGIFDLEKLEIVKHISLDGGDVVFAAGRRHLLLNYQDKSRLERWNLETFERELTVESPFRGVASQFEMGWNSDGPAIAYVRPSSDRMSAGNIVLVDPDRLKVIEIDAESSRSAHMSSSGPLIIRPSASGSHFGWWRTQVSPSGVGMSRIDAKKLHHAYMHSTAGYVVPSDDGTFVFTGGGLYLGEELASREGIRQRDRESQAPVLPATDGPFYLEVQAAAAPGAAEKDVRGSLGLLTTRQKIVTLDFPIADRWSYFGMTQDGELTRDRRVWLIPRAKLFISIPSTNDRLQCRRLDVDAILDRAGIDYLFIGSQPPTRADLGKPWTYQAIVKSRKGGVKMKAEAMPDGMKFDAVAGLSWTPKVAGEFTVILLASDASGQEVYHSFKVTVK